MVVHLTTVMDLPLREQNLVLRSAGFPPAHSERPLADLPEVEHAVRLMLTAAEPFMAVCVDRLWNVIDANQAATRFTNAIFDRPPEWFEPPLNVFRFMFHPEGARHHLVEWEATAKSLIHRLRRDVASMPGDTELRALLDEVEAFADLGPTAVDVTTPADLVVPIRYVVAGQEIALFSVLSTIGAAHDLTAAELRIETFLPADPASERAWLAQFSQG